MTPADGYRTKAAECEAIGQLDPNPLARIEFQVLAKAYRRLAQLADSNARTDIVYEPPLLAPRPPKRQPKPT